MSMLSCFELHKRQHRYVELEPEALYHIRAWSLRSIVLSTRLKYGYQAVSYNQFVL